MRCGGVITCRGDRSQATPPRPAPVAPFPIRAETDDITFDVSGGADFFTHANASRRVSYDGRFGDDIEVHASAARGRLAF